jgi:excisionase family DNA binding protein
MVSDIQIESMLTVREVARLLNIHSNTLRRWSDQGIIKAYRITRRGDRRFSQEDVTHFLAELNANGGNARIVNSTRDNLWINRTAAVDE